MSTVLRVAVIADIHGNIAALQAVEEDIARRGAAIVINLGDEASGALWPGETVDMLMRQSWIQIAGNCDRQIVAQAPSEQGASDRFAFERLTGTQKEWLAALPATATVLDEIRLFHGTPRDDTSYLSRRSSTDRSASPLGSRRAGAARDGDGSARRALCALREV